jgi:hypothetical protein
MSLRIVSFGDDRAMEKLNSNPDIGLYSVSPKVYASEYFYEYTRSYLSLRLGWYTPCAENIKVGGVSFTYSL